MVSRLTAYAVTTAAFAALLSGCGGGSGSGSNLGNQSYSVSLNVSGLTGSLALELVPGNSALTVTANGLTTFGTPVPSGQTYVVSVTTQPAAQYCVLPSNSGTISADVTLNVTCNTSFGGIWKATVGSTQYFQIADETGNFYVLAANSSVGFGSTLTEIDTGTANVANNVVTGTYVGATLSGDTFPDGSDAGSGTLTGNIVSGTSLDLTTTFTTTTPTVYSQTPDYTYDPLYESPSSLAAVAANYVDSQNDVWSITSSGIVTMQSPSTDCFVNGQVSVIDSRYNVYDIQLLYANCTGSSSGLNGLTFYGIVTLDTEVSPAAIIGGATATVTLPTGQGELLEPLLLQSN